jgi:hypothetical protein
VSDTVAQVCFSIVTSPFLRSALIGSAVLFLIGCGNTDDLHDRGEPCFDRYVDYLTCIDHAHLSCDADGDDEQQVYPAEDAAFFTACYP